MPIKIVGENPKGLGHEPKIWLLRLYVVGITPKSQVAIDNLTHICEEDLKGSYTCEVIDLVEQPKLAKEEQILAVPTLLRKLPLPIRRVIGNLSDTEKVLVGLDIIPHKN